MFSSVRHQCSKVEATENITTESGNAKPIERCKTSENVLNELDNANLLADDILDKAKVIEPYTTDFMKSLEANGGHLEGLEYRLKSKESLSRKIIADSHIKGVSLEDAASNIGDSLRYTLVSDEANYTKMVNNSLEQLQKNGYVVNKLKNYWGDDIYQGINVT